MPARLLRGTRGLLLNARALAGVAALGLAGCRGELSALDPAGPGAEAIAAIWWIMFTTFGAVFIGVVALGLYAALRRPDRRLPYSRRLFLAGGGLVLPLSVMAAILIPGLRTGEALLPRGEDALRIFVTAHRWWWEVRYPGPDGAVLHSAHELHIPAGRPVEIAVEARDVIHSFWAPRLGGKIDAIPGQINRILLTAPRPGAYRGQCAEFCGAQHARMHFLVIAHEEPAFQARLAALAARRLPPGTAPAGAATFGSSCAACHALDPREAGRGAPNLADLALRRALGAGTLENGPEALRLWLREHQRLKPGNLMPAHDQLDDAALDAVARYLEAGR